MPTIKTLFITLAALGSLPLASLAHEKPGGAAKTHSDSAHAHATTAEVTIKTEVLPNEQHAAGRSAATVVRLTGLDGKPVTLDQLEMAHTEKIHLLIVDESLGDYHHKHPAETGTPGEYQFDFAPKHGGNYHVWADLVPKATGKQEYSKTLLAVQGSPAPVKSTINRTATVNGFHYELATENNAPLQAGKATMVKVKVKTEDGRTFQELEPVMGAFAHMVGFTSSLDSVTHVHPMGKEPESEAERGGPELSFHVMPEKPGYLKLYVQTQIRGRDEFAAFGLNVETPAETKGAGPATTKSGATQYHCPMHPEVAQSKPGKCPKCGGMDLVPVEKKPTPGA
jgi:hypothetical protein